eukprot:730106-Amphidinium_carterae.1
MKDAGVPQQQFNLAFGHFDERAAQHFTNPNVRNLADMNGDGHLRRDSRRAGQGKQIPKIMPSRPRTVQNFFNARIHNLHAAPLPTEAEGEDTRSTPRLQRHTVS